MSSLNTDKAPWQDMSNKNKMVFYMNDTQNYPLWLKKKMYPLVEKEVLNAEPALGVLYDEPKQLTNYQMKYKVLENIYDSFKNKNLKINRKINALRNPSLNLIDNTGSYEAEKPYLCKDSILLSEWYYINIKLLKSENKRRNRELVNLVKKNKVMKERKLLLEYYFNENN